MNDLIVIGAGPGGYVAAIRAAQLGMKVTVIEKDACGGTCLNYGCIPAKALYKNAQIINYMEHSRDFGIEVDGYHVDMEKVQARKNTIVSTLTEGVEYLFRANKVELIKGRARIVKEGTVEVSVKGGETQILLAKRILIASGSKSSRLFIPGMELPGVITSKEALDIKQVPKNIVIIGGGVIGVEFAGIYKAFGAEVTVVEFMSHIIPNVDVEITDKLKALLEKRGIKILTGMKIEKIEKRSNSLCVHADAPGETLVLACDQVLVSTGREMDVEGLNLEGVGIAFDQKGIKVDDNYETNIRGIYAIGDVTGRVMLAHVASEEGKTAVERMNGINAEVDYDLIPNSIFTFPDVSSIGLSEEQARERRIDYVTSKYQFSGNGKAQTMNDTEGMVKVIASKDKERILGVHILGPNASDLIAEAAIAMNGMFTVEEAAHIMHGHPTLSEAFEEALSNLLGRAIHMPPVKK